MGTYDFDQSIDRRALNSIKWVNTPEDVIPLWVADMDFLSPPAVTEAIKSVAETRSFGYTLTYPELIETIQDRLKRLYHWQVKSEAIIALPGLVPMFAYIPRIFSERGSATLIQTPIYHHFLSGADVSGQRKALAELTPVRDGQQMRYEVDFDSFEAMISDDVGLFTLCNPHNPVGRAYTRDELSCMAEICLKNDLMIVSDEIHCDLLLDDVTHVPIASIAPEIAKNTITLMAPSKVFNLPGLKFAFAVIENDDIRNRFMANFFNLLPGANIFGQVAAIASYKHGQAWLDELLIYLQANRDFVVDYIQKHMPDAVLTVPEATYLEWIDFRAYPIPDQNAFQFFLDKARVQLQQGLEFGESGRGFVRLNFGTRRALLEEALERMHSAIEGL